MGGMGGLPLALLVLVVQSIHSWPGGRGFGGFQCQSQSIHRLVTLLCSRWASRAALVRITCKQTQANGWCQQTQANGLAFRMAFAQGVALVLECGWIKGLGRLFLQLLPLVLPINT